MKFVGKEFKKGIVVYLIYVDVGVEVNFELILCFVVFLCFVYVFG